jgi:hypothetical protein
MSYGRYDTRNSFYYNAFGQDKASVYRAQNAEREINELLEIFNQIDKIFEDKGKLRFRLPEIKTLVNKALGKKTVIEDLKKPPSDFPWWQQLWYDTMEGADV